MKTMENVKETSVQPLDMQFMQAVNGGSFIPPGTDIAPTTCILRERYHKNPWLIHSGTGENAA